MFSFLTCRRAAAFLLAALFMLAAAPRHALAQDYGWFSLDLPQGWQAEAPADMAGTWILSLTGPDDAVHVRVLVGKTAGPRPMWRGFCVRRQACASPCGGPTASMFSEARMPLAATAPGLWGPTLRRACTWRCCAAAR